MFMLRDVSLGDDVFGLFEGHQKCVISTPNGWSLTRLLNLSRTHLLIIAEVENQSHALQLVLPKTLLQTFVERTCPSLSTKVVGRAFIITRTWMRT